MTTVHIPLCPHEADALYGALHQHTGFTLCPSANIETQRRVTVALDKLRGAILDAASDR